MKTLSCFLLGLVLAIAGCAARPVKPVTVGTLIPGSEATVAAEATLHMDVDFTPEERSDLQLAADIWRKQTNGLARISLVYDLDFGDILGLGAHIYGGDHMVVRRTSEMQSVQDSDAESGCIGCVLGWMNSGGIHSPSRMPIYGAFVVDRLDAWEGLRLAVMLHEFGHVLGLPHVPAIQGIMYPHVHPGRTNCLKKADLVSFCSVNECGTTILFPCE